jgi:hypothetical protein
LLLIFKLYLNAILPWGNGGDDAYVFFIKEGPPRIMFSNLAIVFIQKGEVCVRDTDDTRLIPASVNAPPFMVGSHFQTPQSCDHPDQWATFLPGEQGFGFALRY